MFNFGETGRRSFLLMVFLALPLLSCESPNPAGAPRDSLLFRPTPSFDSNLAASLRAGTPKVRIAFAGRVKLEDPPGNLEKWFAAVERGGGQVQRVERSAGFAGAALALLPLILPRLQSMFEEVAQSRTYAAAQGYNVQLYFAEDGETIKEALFVKN